MKNLSQMMKQAQEMQTKMAQMQEKLGEIEVSGQSGAGMVTATLNGKGEMRGLKIDKSLVDPEDVEVLEDLVVAAVNDAKGKVEAQVQEETQRVMGGLKLPPGMKLPF
ncbi:YbaB/EbfC family nucleoid-associated protein [Inquilinus sp. CAU 1745]|uniref:YbaB/EbfC family nucleoid-associated protein n=1 Tax=Inquilinus sp. CAU 1745 TaxID=3140369 RepID=UPI00325AA812